MVTSGPNHTTWARYKRGKLSSRCVWRRVPRYTEYSAVSQVLESSVRKWELTLPQAIGIVKRAFFENANRIYNLGLEPRIQR